VFLPKITPGPGVKRKMPNQKLTKKEGIDGYRAKTNAKELGGDRSTKIDGGPEPLNQPAGRLR